MRFSTFSVSDSGRWTKTRGGSSSIGGDTGVFPAGENELRHEAITDTWGRSPEPLSSHPQDRRSAPETVSGGRQRGVLRCPLGQCPGEPVRPPARLALCGGPHQQGLAGQGAEVHAGDGLPAHGGCCLLTGAWGLAGRGMWAPVVTGAWGLARHAGTGRQQGMGCCWGMWASVVTGLQRDIREQREMESECVMMSYLAKRGGVILQEETHDGGDRF